MTKKLRVIKFYIIITNNNPFIMNLIDNWEDDTQYYYLLEDSGKILGDKKLQESFLHEQKKFLLEHYNFPNTQIEQILNDVINS